MHKLFLSAFVAVAFFAGCSSDDSDPASSSSAETSSDSSTPSSSSTAQSSSSVNGSSSSTGTSSSSVNGSSSSASESSSSVNGSSSSSEAENLCALGKYCMRSGLLTDCYRLGGGSSYDTEETCGTGTIVDREECNKAWIKDGTCDAIINPLCNPVKYCESLNVLLGNPPCRRLGSGDAHNGCTEGTTLVDTCAGTISGNEECMLPVQPL